MKVVIAAFVFVLVGALNSQALFFQTIDPAHPADTVNGKVVSMPTVNLNSVAQPTRGLPSATLDKGTLKLKNAETGKTRQYRTLDQAIVPEATAKQQNFEAKRAAIREDKVNQGVVSEPKAPISKRQLRPYAPLGEDELKRQLDKPR
jgi:hypothetical protein